MIDENSVRLLLRDKLLTSGISLPPKRAYQGVEFDIPSADQDASWLREHMMIIDETASATGMMTVIGAMTWSLFVVAGSGMSQLSAYTLDIANEFSPGQWVRKPGFCSVHLYKTQRQDPRIDQKDPVWHMQNVIVFWRAHPPNPTTP